METCRLNQLIENRDSALTPSHLQALEQYCSLKVIERNCKFELEGRAVGEVLDTLEAACEDELADQLR